MIEQVLMTLGASKAKILESNWVYSAKFHHFQKTNKEVYAYVTPQLFGRWVAQLYQRGDTYMCMLEARIEEDQQIEKLFELAEKWLEKYSDGFDEIEKDPYYPFQADWQGEDITNKELAY